MTDSAITHLAAMLNAFVGCVAKMKADEDTREPILVGCLRETGKRATHFGRATALLRDERQGQATRAEADLIVLGESLPLRLLIM